MYEGEWSEDGRKEGAGVLSLVDGSKYVGEFSGGLSQVYINTEQCNVCSSRMCNLTG